MKINFILIIGCILFVTACGRGDGDFPPQAVTLLTIQPKTIPVVFEYVGQAQSSRLVEIRAKVEGYIDAQKYLEGTLVPAGAVLFELEKPSFLATLENAKGELAGEEARLANTGRQLKRLSKLIKESAISQKDYDEAMYAHESAKAAVQSARARYRTAELNLSYATITAPFSGLTGRAQQQEGSLVRPQDGLLTTLSKIDPIWVNFSVSENDMLKQQREEVEGRLQFPPAHNFTVELILADGRQFKETGKVNFTDPSVDPETGTFGLRAQIPNPKDFLRPGQFVRVKLLGAQRPNAILVPQRAVMQGQAGKYVYVVNAKNTAEIRPVEVGDWVGDDWIITKGLAKGDKVITEGMIKVQPGMPVQEAKP